jgi:predicted ATP-grasp superfamily ATP-dependent carboligase
MGGSVENTRRTLGAHPGTILAPATDERRATEPDRAVRALIVETGHARGALAAARGLAAAGWTIGVGAPGGRGLASASKAATRSHHVPRPEAGVDAFVAGVRAAIRDGGYEVVFPSGDSELLALSARREEVGAIVPYAPHDVVIRAHDKLELVRAAARAAIATPRTVALTEDGDVEGMTPPYVVKPSLHAPGQGGTVPARLTAFVAHDYESAVRRAAEIRASGTTPLLQELVRGRLMAYSVVADADARAIAYAAQVADAIWPPGSGVSSRARSIPVDPDLLESVGRLLSGLGWFGLAQLQFVAAPGDPPRLIDFNGRFYGSLALAIGAGLNLPAIWAALATRSRSPRLGDATIGVKYVWLEGDIRRALVERRGGLVRDLRDSLRYSRGAVHSVWAADDPRPALRYLANGMGRMAKRIIHQPS